MLDQLNCIRDKRRRRDAANLRVAALRLLFIKQYPWLGNVAQRPQLLSLEKLKKEVKKYKIRTGKDYLSFRSNHNKIEWPNGKVAESIPAYYSRIHLRNVTWTEILAKKKVSFGNFKKEMKKHSIKSLAQYYEYRKKHNRTDLPGNPDSFYRKSCYELFGKLNFANISLPKLKKEISRRKVFSASQYRGCLKNGAKWPSNPTIVYNITWNQLFGKERPTYLPLEQLKKQLKVCCVNSQLSYKKYRRDHKKTNWPPSPFVYNISWGELFDKQIVRHKKLSLKALTKEVKKLKITTSTEYQKYRKMYNKTNWPVSPHKNYRYWVSYHYFFH